MARKRKKKESEPESAGFTEESTVSRPRLTPVDIQQKVFRLAFRGYNERDVDEFLDTLTEEVAGLHEENKRLREQLAEGGGSPKAVQTAERQAEAIVRQAREHAARLMDEAEGRGGSALGALPTSFLLRERQFLQELASLVQSHARSLKEEARRAKTTSPPPPPEEPDVPEAPTAAVGAAPHAAAMAAQHRGAWSAEASADDGENESSSRPEAPMMATGAEGERHTDPGHSAEPDADTPAEAAWGPTEPAPGEIIGEPTAAWPSPDPREEQDPLLSAWESAFLADSDSGSEDAGSDPALEPYQPEASNSKKKEEGGEPSLRELFWGEE